MTTWINIVPSDYNGDYTKSLAYAIGGVDVVVSKKSDWRDAAESKMRELGIEVAGINCMWTGGYSDTIEISEPAGDANDNDDADVDVAAAIAADNDYYSRTNAIYAMSAGGEKMDLSDVDNTPAYPSDR